eukprot:4232200-Prymnesium_polylepis.1
MTSAAWRLLCSLALLLGAEALSMPSRPTQRRRDACNGAAALLVGGAVSRPRAASAAQLAGVSPSKMLTIGQYLEDLREARLGLKLLVPLVEGASASDCEEIRQGLRKPPVQNVRKAASKSIMQLDEKSQLRTTKDAQYTAIKKSLGALDDACRDGVDRSKLDLPGMLATLSDQIAAFEG